MKRTLLFLFALLVLTAGASAQPRVQGKAIGFEEYTFANRPSPPSSGEGHTIYVTDCADATCASGGGSTVVQQRWNGTAWVTVSGGVGGGGTPGGSSKSIQYNNAGAFGGVGPGSDGQYISYQSGDPVLTTPSLPGVAVSGTSLTLTSAHNMTRVNMTSASAKSVGNTGGEAAGYYTQLRNAGGGTLTFTPVSGTVNGAASVSCNTQYAILELRTDGTNWEGSCVAVTPDLEIRTDSDGTAALLASDRGNQLNVGHATANAVSIAQAGTIGFEKGYAARLCTTGTGVTTLTPTTSTINGNTTLTLNQGDCALVISDGTNYFASVARTYFQMTYLHFSADGGVLEDTDDVSNISSRLKFPITIVEICGETDTGTSTFNLQRDDGTPANIASSNITATTSNACTSTFSSGENILSAGHKIGFVQVTGAASGSPTQITVTIAYLRR